MVSYKVTVYLCLVVTACALPAQEEARSSSNAIQTESDLLDTMYKDCLRKDSLACGKYKLFSIVDKMLGQKDTITVTDGVQIVKTEGGESEGAPRALSADEGIEGLIMNRVARFLESHTIKIDLKGSEIVNTVTDTARSLGDVVDSFSEDDEPLVEEGRKKKKGGKKGMGPLMGLAALKMAFLAKLALAGIALIAGKALLIGKLALVLSAIIGLKKLLSGKGGGKHVTYEVVSHPQHSSSHTSSHESVYGGSGGGYGGDAGGFGGSSGHGGWGRSLDAQTLAYKAQIPQQ